MEMEKGVGDSRGGEGGREGKGRRIRRRRGRRPRVKREEGCAPAVLKHLVASTPYSIRSVINVSTFLKF
jgi:hypothetical protein